MWQRTAAYVVALGLCCALAALATLRACGIPLGTPYLVLLVYFPVVGGLLLLWQEHGLVKGHKGFILRFMLGLVLKLLLSLALFFLVVRAVPHEQVMVMTALFTALYFIWLAFATVRLSLHLRQARRP